ncbi:diguanylate cyclase [bacterium]|nr:diguanylate cyclase [bacterium]
MSLVSANLIPRRAWREVLSKTRVHHLASGDMLFEQDASAESLWMVRRGTVELFKSFFGEKHRLLYVSRGAVLGEAELFGREPRFAYARAATDVIAYELPSRYAREYLVRFPAATLALLQASTHRSRDIAESLVEQLVQRNLELQMHQARLDPQIRRRVKDLEQTNEHLQQLAWVDALTGCHNRRSLEKVLQMACEAGEPFALAMFDVDHFKHYNDTNGHPEGDRALQTLARLLQRRLRANDVLARYGGEEFCLILRDVGPEVAPVVLERLRSAITEYPFPYEERQPLGDFTVSMGLAMFPGDGTSPDRLIKSADERLYEAKRQGRNRLIGGSSARL